MEYKLNPNLQAIITAIRTDIHYVDLLDLMDWCIEENYLKEYYTNFNLISSLVQQHNESRYLSPIKKD